MDAEVTLSLKSQKSVDKFSTQSFNETDFDEHESIYAAYSAACILLYGLKGLLGLLAAYLAAKKLSTEERRRGGCLTA